MLYHTIVAGGEGVERDRLEQLLGSDDEASVADLAVLCAGASHVVWDGTTSAESLARIYGRRLRLTLRKGIETTGLEQAVQRLSRYGGPVRLGQIREADGAWTFVLFLNQDGSALVACTGVRRTPTEP
ncbi:hypothetical protein [Streptomyces hyaluromycini]|uniref:hypothetical protein n=1 Tax=Streptomyces hyaluromycini TaxID=1377993 RepID=UPI001237B4EB|nr:hypothetical protein [Streptomyces hyaluromycini]